jgi:hypothetical protein
MDKIRDPMDVMDPPRSSFDKQELLEPGIEKFRMSQSGVSRRRGTVIRPTLVR